MRLCVECEALSEVSGMFRRSKPPLVAVWGKNDPFFIPAGAKAFRNALPNAEVQFLDTGHYATETHFIEIALPCRSF